MLNKLCVATTNKGKLKEIKALLPEYEILGIDDLGIDFDVCEDGDTFAANSYKKADALFKLTGLSVMADDSGLCVDALSGAPGIYSARYGGEDGNDEKNNDKLLKLLDGVPAKERTAKFVSVITMVYPDGTVLSARGECPGRIITVPTGDGGFGYDPLFVPEGYDKTFAQLTPEEKNAISHRAAALAELEKLLEARA